VKLREQPVVFLDCQTTGAKPPAGNILELAWSVGSAELRSEIKALIIAQPDEQTVPTRIQRLTGITDEHLIDAVNPDDAYAQLVAAQVNHCVIHYAQFERPFLQHLSQDSFPFDIFCTHQIAIRLFPNLPSRGIRGLAGYFGTAPGEMKRARCHVEATMLIWKHLVDELESNGIDSVEQLAEWLAEPVKVKRTGYEYPLDKIKRLQLPDVAGVYRMLNRNRDVLYVGKATSLKSRVNSYFRGKKGKDPKKLEMLAQVWDIDVTECKSAVEAALLETDEIKRLDPPYNISLKKRHRNLWFYSKELDSLQNDQDDVHRVGPFSSELVFDSLLLLCYCINEGSFDVSIFYDTIELEMLQPAFDIVCQRNNCTMAQLKRPRSLLALAMKLYRQALLAQDAELAALLEEAAADTLADGAAAEESMDGKLSLKEPDVAAQKADEELTVEDVADKFERLLMRAAINYRRTKTLTALLNSQVLINESGSVLTIREGKILYDAERSPATTSLPWKGLDIDSYDRMSVLLQEINRARATLVSPST
jgi:DNA polymerase III subunit epsilon